MKLIIHARHADLADDFSQIVEEKINSSFQAFASLLKLLHPSWVSSVE